MTGAFPFPFPFAACARFLRAESGVCASTRLITSAAGRLVPALCLRRSESGMWAVRSMTAAGDFCFPAGPAPFAFAFSFPLLFEGSAVTP